MLTTGCPLVACRTEEALGFTNAEFFTVVSLTPLTLEGESGQHITIEPGAFQRNFRLCHSMVFQVAQGRSAPGSVCLWEVDSKHFTMRHLVVGLSRARSLSLVTIKDGLQRSGCPARIAEEAGVPLD